MKQLVLITILFFAIKLSHAQTFEETYPKNFWCSNDTNLLKFSNYPEKFLYLVSRKDKTGPGTDANPNLFATIYFVTDSVRLTYDNNLPYAHIFYINFESPKGKTTLRIHFNDPASYFTKNYISQNNGNVQFDIPGIYELANII